MEDYYVDISFMGLNEDEAKLVRAFAEENRLSFQQEPSE